MLEYTISHYALWNLTIGHSVRKAFRSINASSRQPARIAPASISAAVFFPVVCASLKRIYILLIRWIEIMINHFNFAPFSSGYFLLTNDFGAYSFLTKQDIRALLSNTLDPDSEIYSELRENGFLLPDRAEEIAEETVVRYRKAKGYLLSSSVFWALPVSTQWHIHSECPSSNTNKKTCSNSTFCRE